MAQPFPQERDADSQRVSQQETSSYASPSSSSTQQYTFSHEDDRPGVSRQTYGPVRSNPIAIVRNNRAGAHPDSSDDEDREIEIDDVKWSSGAQSLPAGLLRAPKLGSLPTNDDHISYHNMLPPPMNLSEPASSGAAGVSSTERGISYGSLRDSHIRGRFLDGPSSYRDSRTGDIRRLQHRVRFQDQTSTARLSSTAPVMSIGERLMSSRKQRVDNKKNGPSSSLSAMLDGMEGASAEEPLSPGPLQFYEMDGHEGPLQDTSHMLSTSLTGLELLQSGFRPSNGVGGTLSASSPVMEELDELPRDENGRSNLLSRSFSDPTPHMGRRVLPLMAPSPLSSSDRRGPLSPRYSTLPPPHTLPQASAASSQAYQANFLQKQGLSQDEHLMAYEHENPDTEAAFDMDLE